MDVCIFPKIIADPERNILMMEDDQMEANLLVGLGWELRRFFTVKITNQHVRVLIIFHASPHGFLCVYFYVSLIVFWDISAAL
jgi:hypothetical protein